VNGVPVPEHVRVDLDGAASESWRRCADVLYGSGTLPLAAALLVRYPGCLLVSLRDAGGDCVTLARTGGGRVDVRVRRGVRTREGHTAIVTGLYARLVAGTY
jgi:hypothetical protein